LGLPELAYGLVAWQAACVILARALHAVKGAEGAATVVTDADRGGVPLLSTTIDAGVVMATQLGERPTATA
jgi:hypothetical protein